MILNLMTITETLIRMSEIHGLKPTTLESTTRTSSRNITDTTTTMNSEDLERRDMISTTTPLPIEEDSAEEDLQDLILMTKKTITVEADIASRNTEDLETSMISISSTERLRELRESSEDHSTRLNLKARRSQRKKRRSQLKTTRRKKRKKIRRRRSE